MIGDVKHWDRKIAKDENNRQGHLPSIMSYGQ